MTAAAFLDRDGVINRKAPDGRYVTSWEEFEFLPGVPAALRSLSELGMRIVVVTNQRGIALGAMDSTDVDEIHERMLAALSEAGAPLDGVFVCPHEAGACACRKPATGLFLEAVERFPDISLAESVVVGDSVSDIEAGNRLGCRVFLVATEDRRTETMRKIAERGLRIDAVGSSLAELVGQGLFAARAEAVIE